MQSTRRISPAAQSAEAWRDQAEAASRLASEASPEEAAAADMVDEILVVTFPLATWIQAVESKEAAVFAAAASFAGGRDTPAAFHSSTIFSARGRRSKS